MYSAYAADFTADSTTLCQGQNADYTDLSTATPTSWSWTFPGGTPGTSTLQHPQNIVYNTPGTYNVSLTVMYGTTNVSVTKSSYITVNPSTSAPLQPVGDTLLCENNANTTYTTQPVPGATSYTWTLTPSAAGVLTPNNTSATIDWANGWTGYAALTVQATGQCGISLPSPALNIHLRPFPGTPGIPAGLTTLCEGVGTNDYTVSSVPNASSYTWRIVPASAGTITGNDTIGTVYWSATFNGVADISVKAVNECNESSYSSPLSVHVFPIPAVSLGPDTILCDFQTILLDAGNPGASYLWSTGATTQTILVDSSGIGYNTGDWWVLVTQDGCTGNDTIGITFTVCQGIAPVGNVWDVLLYPNPNNGTFTLEIEVPKSEEAEITLVNLFGQELYKARNVKIQHHLATKISLPGVPPGIYHLILQGRSSQNVLKVVVE